MQIFEYNSVCKIDSLDSETENLIRETLTYRTSAYEEVGRLKGKLKWINAKLKSPHITLQERDKFRKTKFATIKQIEILEPDMEQCWYSQGKFPTGLLNIVEAILKKQKRAYTLVDRREIPPKDQLLVWKTQPPKLRYYQEEAIAAALQATRGVISSAVGTGKSLMEIVLVKRLQTVSLIIVPSSALLEQIYDDFALYLGSHKVEQITTAKVVNRAALKPIRIVTIQTMRSLLESGNLGYLMEGVNAVLMDEFHHAGSQSYTSLLPHLNNVYYRYGFTGTFLRTDESIMAMWGVLSNTIYKYSAKQAIKDGYLVPSTIYVHSLKGKRKTQFNQEYDKNYCANPDVMNLVLGLHLNSDPETQILTLVKKKDKSGKILHEYLKRNGIDNAYISGDDRKEVIMKTIRAFNACQIRSMIGSTVIGEGVDVRSTDRMIQAQGWKSEIAVVQSMGRAIRLFDGKQMAHVHEIDFTGTKYLHKHLLERLDIYERNFGSKIVYV